MSEQFAQLYLIKSFVNTIQSQTTISYSNTQNRKQACVGLIFRFSQTLPSSILSQSLLAELPDSLFLDYVSFESIVDSLVPNEKMPEIKDEIFEMLFIQRAENKNDKHSGEIALPGGKCDGDENDFDAVIREIREEIGFDILNPKNKIKYLGKFNKNVYLNKKLKCSIAVFFDFGRNELQINRGEIQEFKWIPASTLMKIEKEKFGTKISVHNHMIGAYSKILPAFIAKELMKQYTFSIWASYDIGMKDYLWGITFQMLIYMFEVFAFNVENCKDKKLVEYFQKVRLYEGLILAIKACEYVEVKFRENSPKGVKEIGKFFDLEWRMFIHNKYGFRSNETLGKKKKTFDQIFRGILYFILANSLIPKF